MAVAGGNDDTDGMKSAKQHWESVHRNNDPNSVGWYQPKPTLSMRLLLECNLALDAPIVNIGGGSSSLVDHVLDAGFTDVTVLDVSATGLGLAQQRLGLRSADVEWIVTDVTTHRFDRSYQLWHDRAVLHFLTDPDDQARYVGILRQTVAAGGHVIIATFAPDGPDSCSGLPVQRHSEESLTEALGGEFEPVCFENEIHRTPGGSDQAFLYGCFRRIG